MFGGKNCNTTAPVFLDENRVQHHSNASNQLQLFGNSKYYFSEEYISFLIYKLNELASCMMPVIDVWHDDFFIYFYFSLL